MAESERKRRIKAQLMNGRALAPCCHCRALLPASKLTLDHVTPRAEGGRLVPKNLRLCCLKCNHRRGTRPFSEFQRETRTRIAASNQGRADG